MTDRGTRWTPEELKRSVVVYSELFLLQQSGQTFTKAPYARRLAEELGRSVGSIEYRFQNISAVLSRQGSAFVSGYLPAHNVGAAVAANIAEELVFLGLLPTSVLSGNTRGKQDVVNEICDLVGIDRLQVSVGSSVPASLFSAASEFVGLDNFAGGMDVRAQRVVASMGLRWLPGIHDSSTSPSGGGGTVQLEGLEQLLRALRIRGAVDLSDADQVLDLGNKMAQISGSVETDKPMLPAPVAQDKTLRMRYVRDPKVVRDVFNRANGQCECCGDPAPFVRGSDGTPFLELHHVVPLSDDGSDRIENAIACCPNCHRALHHASDASQRREALYKEVSRLVRE